MIEIEDFIRNFSNQFDETNPEAFTPDTIFHDIDEFSSLIALSIIAMVDEEYEVQLKGSEMRSAATIQDLFNIVKSKIEQ